MWGKESPCRGWGVIGHMAGAGGSTGRRGGCVDKGSNPPAHGHSRESTEARAVQDRTRRSVAALPAAGGTMRPWFCRELGLLWSFAVCFVPCFLSSSSHHSHEFYLLSLHLELLALAALWMLPVLEKSHLLFTATGLQRQRGLEPEPVQDALFITAMSGFPRD